MEKVSHSYLSPPGPIFLGLDLGWHVKMLREGGAPTSRNVDEEKMLVIFGAVVWL